VYEFGRYASSKERYFGFKLHALTSVDRFLTYFAITPANLGKEITDENTYINRVEENLE